MNTTNTQRIENILKDYNLLKNKTDFVKWLCPQFGLKSDESVKRRWFNQGKIKSWHLDKVEELLKERLNYEAKTMA